MATASADSRADGISTAARVGLDGKPRHEPARRAIFRPVEPASDPRAEPLPSTSDEPVADRTCVARPGGITDVSLTGDVLAAPAGALGIPDASTVTHRIGLSVPIR